MNKNLKKDWIYSYDAAWNSSIRVHFSNRYFSFSVSMQEFFIFFFIELFMFFLDQVLGISFALFVHYLFVPGAIVYALRKVKPEGKPVHQWMMAWVKFLFSDKHCGGNFDEIDVNEERFRLLSRKS